MIPLMPQGVEHDDDTIITGDVDAWFGMLDRGDFAVIWDAQQASFAAAAAKPLALGEREVAELMRIRSVYEQEKFNERHTQ